MFLTGLNLTCSNLKTLRKTSNHGAINPIDHAHKLTRQFHVHAVFNTFHPHKHPLWTHKRTFSALNTVWHEIFARSNFGEFSRDLQRFFQRYNFKSAVKCSCPCLTCPKTYDTKTNAVMFNALALLSLYMVLEPRDSCNYPFFTFCVTVDTEGNRSPSDDQTLLFTSEEKRVIEDQWFT